MSLLLNETVSVNRFSNSFTDEGRPQTDSTTAKTIKANIQPLKGNEILALPEGERERENNWCYTDFQLVVNDEVTRLDKKFTVKTVENWSVFGSLQHFKCRLISKDVQ